MADETYISLFGGKTWPYTFTIAPRGGQKEQKVLNTREELVRVINGLLETDAVYLSDSVQKIGGFLWYNKEGTTVS